MRKLLALLLIAVPAFAQFNVNVVPTISTKTIPTVNTISGSYTLSDAGKAFDSITVGSRVFGAGIPQGATVTSLVDAALDSQIVISDTCLATASVSINAAVITGTLYTTGDWLGLPFQILPTTGVGGTTKLISITIVDAADVITATDIVFYRDVSAISGGSGLDNAAALELAANESYILGIVSLTVITDLGAVKIMTKDDINLDLPNSGVWGRMIVRGGPTFTAVNNLRLRFRFQ